MCFLAQLLQYHISSSKFGLCVCLDVNQGGANYNRCSQTLVILRVQTYWWTLVTCQKLIQSDLLYCWKLPAKKCVWIGIFKPAEHHSPWNACCHVFVILLDTVSFTVWLTVRHVWWWRIMDTSQSRGTERWVGECVCVSVLSLVCFVCRAIKWHGTSDTIISLQ